MKTGYEERENIIKYDFNAPFVLSTDIIIELKKICSKHTASLSSYLSSSCDAEFEVSLSGCSEVTYNEVSKVIHDAVYNVSAAVSDTSKSRFFVCADRSMTSIILDCILGSRTAHPFVYENITDLGRELSEKYLQGLSAFVRNIFKQYKISLIKYEPSRNYAETSAGTWAALSYSVVSGTVSGTITFCMPAAFINKLASESDKPESDEITSSDMDKVSAGSDIISEAVKSSVVTLSGILAGTDVTLRDILTLRCGDVIALDAPIDRNAQVMVDGVHVFDARPGLRNNYKALKITKVYDNQ